MNNIAERLYREGDAAHDARQFRRAEQLLRAALTADPGHWLARYTLAVALQDMGRHAEAVPLYAAAVAANPTHLKAWNNYGVALQNSGDADAALLAYRKALALDPRHPGAVANASGLLADMGWIAEARQVLDPLCDAARPTVFDLRRALMVAPIPESAEAIARQRAEMAADLQRLADRPPTLTDPMREVGRTPFYLAYQPESDRALLEALATVYRRACPTLDYTAPHCAAAPGRALKPGRRRIGFASFFFYEHSVGRVIRGLVERLPRAQFEVVVVFLGGQADDALARAMAAAADQAVKTPYAIEAARECIARLELDILCLPDFGMDPLSYFLGFARLAPVQCTTWGHAETSGLERIDWFVSTAGWERPDADADYTERLWRLPDVASPAIYRRPQPAAGGRSLIAPAAGHGNGNGINYFCPQSLYKLHPDLDRFFGDILRLQPTARIYLVRSTRPAWNAALERRLRAALGESYSRVRWLDPMSRPDYLVTLQAADVVLDSIYFSGGNTSFEAFALGRPVVTLAGKTMRSQFTAGMYRAMGLSDLVATTPEEYVRRAVLLGQDAALRAETIRRIENQSAALFDDPAVVTAWTEFLSTVQPAAG